MYISKEDIINTLDNLGIETIVRVPNTFNNTFENHEKYNFSDFERVLNSGGVTYNPNGVGLDDGTLEKLNLAIIKIFEQKVSQSLALELNHNILHSEILDECNNIEDFIKILILVGVSNGSISF